MIVKLIKDHTYNGAKLKKGQTIVTTKADGLRLCEKEIAVSSSDIPCGSKKKKKKNNINLK